MREHLPQQAKVSSPGFSHVRRPGQLPHPTGHSRSLLHPHLPKDRPESVRQQNDQAPELQAGQDPPDKQYDLGHITQRQDQDLENDVCHRDLLHRVRRALLHHRDAPLLRELQEPEQGSVRCSRRYSRGQLGAQPVHLPAVQRQHAVSPQSQILSGTDAAE